jgi:hypothetical protein
MPRSAKACFSVRLGFISRLLKNSFANGLEGRFVSEVVGELDVDGAVIL